MFASHEESALTLSPDPPRIRYTVSELSQRAGVSTASIKFYLRAGLLRGGDLRAERRAYYDDSHLNRLVLIRALRDLARLSIEQVRTLVQLLDRGKSKTFDLVASTVDALARGTGAKADDAHGALRTQIYARLRARGLIVRKDSATLDGLAQALFGLRAFEPALDVQILDQYLEHILPLAEAEFAANEERILASPESAMLGAIVGTVLYEPIILALRRIAHEHLARRLYDRHARSGPH